jgi:hypothetical protein
MEIWGTKQNEATCLWTSETIVEGTTMKSPNVAIEDVETLEIRLVIEASYSDSNYMTGFYLKEAFLYY